MGINFDLYGLVHIPTEDVNHRASSSRQTQRNANELSFGKYDSGYRVGTAASKGTRFCHDPF
jgi:hypothetical protein